MFLLAARGALLDSERMETMLTVMGWVSVGILAWFIFRFLRNRFRALQKPRSRTDNVNKEMY